MPERSTEEPSPADPDALLAPRPRRRRWLVPVAALTLLATAGLLFLSARGRSTRPRFRTERVERTDLAAQVSATGNLEPTNQVDVGSELSGTVAAVLVDTNDTVTAGQVLARLDTAKLEQQTARSRAAVRSAKASLTQAQATRAEAAAQLARYEELSRLSSGRVPSRVELDAARAESQRAEAAVASAEAVVAETEASLRTNETDLTKMVIRSPIDGTVLAREIEPGQTVAASFQAPVLFTIAQDLKKMELKVRVAEADVGAVRDGQHASFTVDAWPEQRFEAIVLKVGFGAKTVENVVSYEAELEVANDDLSLRPGMTATADIRVAERSGVLAVPNAALRFSPPAAPARSRGFSLLPRPPGLASRNGSEKSPGVWVLREGGIERVAATTGLSDGKRTEVEGPGLAEGDQVVIEQLENGS